MKSLEAPELADHQVGAGHSGQNTEITFIMATLVMMCTAPGCDMGEGAPYKTEKVDTATALTLMQMHNAHQPVVQAGQAWEVRPQAERVNRPTLTLSGHSINQEDFEHFQYKERLVDNVDRPFL